MNGLGTHGTPPYTHCRSCGCTTGTTLQRHRHRTSAWATAPTLVKAAAPRVPRHAAVPPRGPRIAQRDQNVITPTGHFAGAVVVLPHEAVDAVGVDRSHLPSRPFSERFFSKHFPEQPPVDTGRLNTKNRSAVRPNWQSTYWYLRMGWQSTKRASQEVALPSLFLSQVAFACKLFTLNRSCCSTSLCPCDLALLRQAGNF